MHLFYPYGPGICVLQADLTCSALTQKEVYDYIISVRDSQQVPLILMDMKQDILMIDQVVSDDVCMVGFDSDGNLKTHEGLIRDEKYNIFCHPLKEILMAAAAKINVCSRQDRPFFGHSEINVQKSNSLGMSGKV